MKPPKRKSKKKVVIANWKMNPISVLEAKNLYKKTLRTASSLKRTSVVIAPPFPYLLSLVSKSTKVSLGAQNGRVEESGAFTGEVSLSMLRRAGVKYVIIGHSERRAMGETDSEVSKKARMVLELGMVPIVCIGESKRDHSGEYLSVIEKQIQGSLAGLSPIQMEKIILAYEPVWAIGSVSKGAMEPRDLHETVLYIQKVIGVKFGRELSVNMNIIYGGSVDSGNARSLITDGEVNGFLVGRASLDAVVFSDMLKAVDGL